MGKKILNGYKKKLNDYGEKIERLSKNLNSVRASF